MGEVVPIHRHPEYMQDCCDLLNSEWPRGDALRLEVMRNSCDELPCSFALLRDLNDAKDVVGYLRLGLIVEYESACSVQSLIIRQDCRRKGLGKHIMLSAENHARGLGFKTCYLATTDQHEFYRHLGYAECEMVNFLSADRLSRNAQLMKKFAIPSIHEVGAKKVELESGSTKKEQSLKTSTPPPPPPLPPSKINSKAALETQTYMKKTL